MGFVLLWTGTSTTYTTGHCCLKDEVHVSEWPQSAMIFFAWHNEISPSPLCLPIFLLQFQYNHKVSSLVPLSALNSKFTKKFLAFPDLLKNTYKQKYYWLSFLQHSSSAVGRMLRESDCVYSVFDTAVRDTLPLIVWSLRDLDVAPGSLSWQHPPPGFLWSSLLRTIYFAESNSFRALS